MESQGTVINMAAFRVMSVLLVEWYKYGTKPTQIITIIFMAAWINTHSLPDLSIFLVYKRKASARKSDLH